MNRVILAIAFVAHCTLYAPDVNAPHTISIVVNVSGDSLVESMHRAVQQASDTVRGLRSYTWRVTGIAAVIGYGCLLVQTQRARWLMSDLNAWLNWNAAQPFEQLLALPHAEVYVALKKAIETRYQSPNLPILVNVTQFLNETNAELACLRRYARVCTWLEHVPLALRVCFVDAASIKCAHESIKRLIFLRTIIAQELEPHNALRRIDLVNQHTF